MHVVCGHLALGAHCVCRCGSANEIKHSGKGGTLACFRAKTELDSDVLYSLFVWRGWERSAE